MKKVILFLSTICYSIIIFPQSISALEKAAEDGDIEAIMFIAKAYQNGNYGVRQNMQKAYQWYLKAARQENSEAQFEVSRIMNFGIGNNNPEEGLKWLYKSADNGYAPAQVTLGTLLIWAGNEAGDPQKNAKAAFEYFIKAAKQSFPSAFTELANCYYNGLGVPRNLDMALEYYQKAVDAGVKSAYLGMAYCYHMKNDYIQYFQCLQKVIETGNPQAYNDIAYAYAEGKGVKQDFKKAHEMIDIAISKSPNQTNFYDSKGEIYLMEGKISKAKEMWEQILILDPNAAKRTDSPLAMAMTNNIDNNIPETSTRANSTFAVIFANEDYKRVAPVPFAKNDGRVFTEYCKKTLGIPEGNIHYVENATLGDMKYHIDLLKEIAQTFNGNAKIILYYAGHGIPDESQKDSYLLPTDGYGNNATSGYSLRELYTELGNIPSKSTIVFIDACFSGAQRNGKMLETARGVAIKPKTEVPTGNLIVFSAASGDETAYPYNEQHHGLFTYFLLKKIQESKGDITLGELSDYLTTNVKQTSIIDNKKSQTPTVIPSQTLKSNWKNLNLK